jgi:hypothetical protein
MILLGACPHCKGDLFPDVEIEQSAYCADADFRVWDSKPYRGRIVRRALGIGRCRRRIA